MHLSSLEQAGWNEDRRFPLASVCKLPMAMHYLALVDEGKYRLDQMIEVEERDLRPWVSPIADGWPREKRFPLSEMLRLMVAQSDNTVIDLLFRLAGGATALARRMRSWQIGDGIRIDRMEGETALVSLGISDYPPPDQWKPEMFRRYFKTPPSPRQLDALRRFIADPRDSATPQATTRLLARAYRKELLQPPTTAFLASILEATTTGPARIKGLLPAGTVVGHKTGTTGTAQGFNGGTNDAGVITLPNGKGQIAISVYIKGSSASTAAREEVIAKIAKAAYDHWTA